MLFFRLAWREIRKRPGRALLTLSSIVIGVAAVIAVTFTTQTTRRAFDDIFETVAGRAGLEVSGSFGTTFDEELLTTISGAPGVEAAAPLIQRRSVIYIGEKRVDLVALGVDPQRDKAVHDYDIVEGQWLDKGPGILLNDSFAKNKNIGLKYGDSVEILTRRGVVKASVIGLYNSRNTATTGQGGVMLMSLRSAQAVFKAPKQVDTIQIVLKPDADVNAVRAEIAGLLPEGLTVRKPAARSAMAEQTSLSTELGLKMARVFAALMAVFIILNTFLMGVTQRRRQLGVMRAIGATRSQVLKLVFSEAVLLGMVGTVLGCGLGYLAARYLVHAMGSLYLTQLPSIQLQPAPFYLAAAFGVGISVIGAAYPAWKASRLSPLDAMRGVLAEELEGVSRWMVIAGGALAVISSVLMSATIGGLIAPAGAIWIAMPLLIGLMLLLVLALKPISTFTAAALQPWMRVEGRLAQRELARHRARTTLTAGVVFLAVATGIGLAIAVSDNVQNVKDWYRKSIVADFFVRATAPDMATGLAADLPDDIDAKIRRVEGIKSIEALRIVSAKAADESIVLCARDFDLSHDLEFDLVHGDLTDVRNRLLQGEVMIGSVLAEQAKLKAGDEISLEVGESTQKFRVAAVANDYQAGGLTMYIEKGVAKRLFGIDGIDAFIINADHEQLSEVRDELLALCEENGLLLQSFSDIQQKIDRMMSGVVAGLWGSVVLGLVVAAFGVANTLMMAVMEQTRELGLLRILAMTRLQVRKSILAQALMIGLLALVPGIFAGIGVAYLISWAALSAIGHTIPFTVHPELLIGAAVGGLMIIIAAAFVPAERAARLELPTALRHM